MEDIVLIDETRARIKNKLEQWREGLENKGFNLTRTKTEQMEHKFSNRRQRSKELVNIVGEEKRPILLFEIDYS